MYVTKVGQEYQLIWWYFVMEISVDDSRETSTSNFNFKKKFFIVRQFKWYRTKDPNANYETGKDVTPMQKGRYIIGMSFSYKRTFFLVGCGHSKLLRGRIKFKRHKMFTKQGSICWRVHSVGTEWIIVVFGDVLADIFTWFSCPVDAFLFPFRIFTMFKKIGDNTQWAA